jgi:hypothetical protein
MFSTRLSRVLVGAVTVLVALALLTGAASAKKKPKPRVFVSPSTGLVNEQTVMVSVSGFVPETALFIVQCTKHVKGQQGTGGEAYCNVHNIVPVMTTSEGTIPPTAFKVLTGVIGSNGSTCGTGTKDSVCYIGVGDAMGTAGNDGLGKIKFAVP